MRLARTVLILLVFFLRHSHQDNVPSGLIHSVRYCWKKHSKDFVNCFMKYSAIGLEHAIESNRTWHINDFISLKRNPDWVPEEEYQGDNIYGRMLAKVGDFVESRSLEFRVPQEGVSNRDGRAMGETGRKKNKGGGGGGGKHGGMMISAMALAAMMAQMFFGKIAFLSAAALILSKVALMLSVVNALKKHSSGGGDHVVYSDQGHGNSWQRSLPPDPYQERQEQQRAYKDDAHFIK